MSNKRQINGGYIWVMDWEKPGDPIYPKFWNEKPESRNPWFTQDDYDECQKIMRENPPEEVLDLEPGTYTLEVTYPLSKVYEKDFEVPEKGITRQELVDLAAEAYHKVYYFVNEGVYADGIDEYSEVWNKYGIWGHGMGDLTIHTFYVDEETNTITLGVDS